MSAALPEAPRAPARRLLSVAGPGLALALGLCLPFLGNPFFLDDWHLLHRAEEAAWTPEGLAGAFTFLDPTSIEAWNHPDGEAARYFRPLVVASLKLDLALFGPRPVPSHAVGLLLHLVAVLLVAALALRLTRDEGTARLATVLFAIQPQCAVAVLWTSGRTELLVAVCVLAGLLAHVAARQERRPRLHLASALFALLACLSKESCVVLPACVGAYELVRALEPGRPVGRRLPEAAVATAPTAAVIGLYLVYRFGVFDAGAPLGPPYFYPLGSAELPARALAKTVYNLLALATTAYVVPLFAVSWLVRHPPALAAVVAAAAALGVAVWRALRGDRRALLAALWLAAALVPTLPILAVELYLYFPAVGFALLAALFIERRVLRKGDAQRRTGRALLAAYLALYALGFAGRGLFYRVEGLVNDRVYEDVRREGGPFRAGTVLLLVNMPVAASHLAPMARVLQGERDVRVVLISVSPEWAMPREDQRIECLGPRRLRVHPPGGRPAFFETEEEQDLQLLRRPLDPHRTFRRPGLEVTPVLDARDRVVALDVLVDRPLDLGLDRVYAFHEAGGRVAHRACGPPASPSRGGRPDAIIRLAPRPRP